MAWRHSYERAVVTSNSNSIAVAAVTRPDGRIYSFKANGNFYAAIDPDVTSKLVRVNDATGNFTNWEYTVAADASKETYDAAGKLLSIQDRAGLAQTLIYSDSTTPISVAPRSGMLLRVSDAYGRQLNFSYDTQNRIAKMIDPAGGEYRYRYDAANNLVSVTYPDQKDKTYQYNETAYTNNVSLPNALTGVIDENAVRFATYYYSADGKAISGQQAGGVNQYIVSRGPDSTTITDPLGTARTYHYETILGVIKTTGQSQPGGAGCGPASSAITYDGNGNVGSRTDFNGTKTIYAYDLVRNLEARRIEGAATAEARTITTQWHATLAMPINIAEPLRRTSFVYDASGNLLSKTVQATADATGVQGFAAAITGPARRWTYTYNNVGQVLTTKGPRTDADDVTTYAYDAQGNLTSVTNALGHVTTLSNYDAHGHAGRITDANGVTTDMSYHPRGWLTSRTVTGAGATETTTYAYDGVGQLTQVTLPDGSAVSYTYDPAHRLTAIADSLGNRIGYTLDAIGNRISEQVRDPNGQLTRQTTRVYDALNRLQQITGSL